MLVIHFQSHTVLTLQDVSFIWYCLGSVSSVLTLQDVSFIWCCLGSVSTVFTESTVFTVFTVFTVLDLARRIFHLILSAVCIHCFGPYQLYLSFGTFWGLCLYLLDWTRRVVRSILSWSLWFLCLSQQSSLLRYMLFPCCLLLSLTIKFCILIMITIKGKLLFTT